MLTIIIIRRNS